MSREEVIVLHIRHRPGRGSGNAQSREECPRGLVVVIVEINDV